MKVTGMKEDGTPLGDIGMTIPFGEVVDIPHNLARRSKTLQEALDAGDVKATPSKAAKAAAALPRARPARPVRPAARKAVTTPSPFQLIAEMRRDLGLLSDRVKALESDNDALRAKLKALKPEKALAKKAPAKKRAIAKKAPVKAVAKKAVANAPVKAVAKKATKSKK